PFVVATTGSPATAASTRVSPNGGAADIVSTCRHGITVDPRCEAAVARALRAVLFERGRWDHHAAAARQNASRFSWARHAADYVRLLNELCTQRQGLAS
ncbi:MAG: hypothetical protein AAGA56_28610, partial [Myxococcota bacterium]